LVVIAIIGILSSVVLASLNSARGKGNNAKVKAQLSAARASAEIYYDTAGSYAPAFSTAACPTTGTNMFTDTASGMANRLGLLLRYLRLSSGSGGFEYSLVRR
jgi:type II secretory pathway pseudopilin PulG